MPKKIILFFLTAALLSTLTGCDGNTVSFVDQSSDTTSALQDAFDTSVKARYIKYKGDGATDPEKNYCHISEIAILGE